MKKHQLRPLFGFSDFLKQVNEMQDLPHSISKKDAQSTEQSTSKSKTTKMCTHHKNQPLKYFCYVCDEEICGFCWDGDHSDARKHGVQKISHAKKRLLLKDREIEVRSRMTIIQDTIPMVESLLKTLTKEYNYLVDQLVSCEKVKSADLDKSGSSISEGSKAEDVSDCTTPLRSMHINEDVLLNCQLIRRNFQHLAAIKTQHMRLVATDKGVRNASVFR